MCAVIATLLFAVAFIEHGGKITVHSPWFDPSGLMYLGLAFLAWHCVRRLGLGNWRQG